MPLVSNGVLPPSFFASPHPLGAPSFAVRFRWTWSSEISTLILQMSGLSLKGSVPHVL